MKKEVSCCDSCEEILEVGGLRMATAGESRQIIDLCAECLAEVLPEYTARTGEDFLTVQISEEDFLVLMGDGAEEDVEEASTEIAETEIVGVQA